MKKSLLAVATLALAISALPGLVSQSEAAARSPYCDMAKNQRNPVAWNAYYGCLDRSQAAAPVNARVHERHAADRAKDPYCDMAKNQKNPVAWNAYYGCLNTSRAEAPESARVHERHAANVTRDPYCDMAKYQRNPVSWNAYYGCLNH